MSLALLALAWMLGIASAAYTSADPAVVLAASGLFSATLFAFRPRLESLIIAPLGVLLIFGAAWRYDATVPDEPPLAAVNDAGDVRLRGVVSSAPDEQGSSRVYRVDVDERLSDGRWQPEAGSLLLRTPLYPEYDYGDLLSLRGDLETPENFGDFDYREYLLRRGIASLMQYPTVRLIATDQASDLKSAVLDVRETLSANISAALPEPEASLASGVLLGTGSDIPGDLRDDMNSTGTSHLVAVSGQNVTIIAIVVLAAFTWLIGRRSAAWCALAAIAAYALVVGLDASVLRAAIMGGLWVAATIVGRQSSVPIALGLAAAVMTALDPQIVHELGFQLSFASVLGLALLGSPLHIVGRSSLAKFPSVAAFPPASGALMLVTMTVASLAFTMPITVLNFDRVSVVAPVANLFAVPAFVAVLATAGLTAAAGLISEQTAEVAGLFAWLPAAYMLETVELFAELPAASVEIPGAHVGHAIAYYTALAAGIWWLGRVAPKSAEPAALPVRPLTTRLLPALSAATVLAAASGLVWLAAFSAEDNRLQVTFLDVGQGEATLVEAPGGARLLVDGGPSGEVIQEALGRHLPFYDRRIDLIVLTHPSADHMSGLVTVLQNYDVGAVLTSPAEEDTGAFRAWQQAVTESGVPALTAHRGQQVQLGDDAIIEVLNPPLGTLPSDPNEGSLVLRLTAGEVSFLLTADATTDTERTLIRSNADVGAQVLKVGHHGSRTSTSQPFLDAVDPAIDIISVGADNGYGHPTSQVLDRLAGDLVLRTDLHGDITISTDGHHLWVHTQHEP